MFRRRAAGDGSLVEATTTLEHSELYQKKVTHKENCMYFSIPFPVTMVIAWFYFLKCAFVCAIVIFFT